MGVTKVTRGRLMAAVKGARYVSEIAKRLGVQRQAVYEAAARYGVALPKLKRGVSRSADEVSAAKADAATVSQAADLLRVSYDDYLLLADVYGIDLVGLSKRRARVNYLDVAKAVEKVGPYVDDVARELGCSYTAVYNWGKRPGNQGVVKSSGHRPRPSGQVIRREPEPINPGFDYAWSAWV